MRLCSTFGSSHLCCTKPKGYPSDFGSHDRPRRKQKKKQETFSKQSHGLINNYDFKKLFKDAGAFTTEMKASIAFLLAACTSTVMGVDIISIITECARDCLLDSVNIATDCKSKDYKCACDNAEEIQNDGQNCVIQACGKWKSLRKSCLP